MEAPTVLRRRDQQGLESELNSSTDLPALSNGHAQPNNHAENGKAYKPMPLDLGGSTVSFSVSPDSPSCADCGSIMVRNGSS